MERTMSETATTVIKLLSALTSPKAAVKYISVAIFIGISWKYFCGPARSFEIPEENISIVVTLAGVGLGSIVGQIISWSGEWFWKSISAKLDARNLEKIKTAEELENNLNKNKENKNLIKIYTKSFPHLHISAKHRLIELTREDITLNLEDKDYKALRTNKYIEIVSHISDKNYLVTLNPVIAEATSAAWEKEVKEKVDKYFLDMTPEESKVLELMEINETGNDSVINLDIVSAISLYHPYVDRQDEEDKGLWLRLRPYYRDEFSRRTGKEYQDDTWIDANRITLPLEA